MSLDTVFQWWKHFKARRVVDDAVCGKTSNAVAHANIDEA
jgi:hypothetical protein